jgi:hypothetical protein
MKKLTIFLSLLLLTGCATAYMPVPEGYTGPTSNLSDSFNPISSSQVEFFYVRAVDGHDIDNSLFASRAANEGRGMSMTPVLIQRPIPASKPTSVTLIARTEYAAPILALTNTVFQVKGNLDFTPAPAKRYIVRGKLSEDYSSVWLEDEDTHEVIGKKIEIHGSAKLGFFEK